MRLSLLFFTSLFVGALFAQTGSPAAGCFPLEVNFTPPSAGTAFWDFGDGVTSNLASPSHVYTAAGTYTVRFFRTQGGPQLGSTTINIYPTPTISLTQDTSNGCAPVEVNFDASVDLNPNISISNFKWAFGDGSSGSGSSPSNTYIRPGTYDVSIEIETNFPSCDVTEIFDSAVEVFPAPNARFDTDPSPVQSCDLPLIVSLSNRSSGADPLTYSWDFGNNTNSSQENPTTVNYDVGGSYVISLTAVDANGCSDSFQVPVTAGPPDANFDLPDTVCINQLYTINALGAADIYTWSSGANVTQVSVAGQIYQVIFTAPGLTTVGLQVENTTDGCSADTTRDIFVQELIVDAESDPSYFCSTPYTINYTVNNPDVTVFWSFPGGQGTSTNPDTSITYDYDKGGEYGQNWSERVNAQVTITSPQGCSASATITDIIDVPNALFVPDVHEGCAPLTVVFADSIRSTDPVTEVIIDWGDGNVQTVANTGPWTHVYQNPGEYNAFMTMENSSGCRDTSYAVLIEVGTTLPSIPFAADVSMSCPGDTLTFTSAANDPRIDAIHFQVEGGDSHHCFDEPILRQAITNPIEGNTIDVVFSVEYNGCITTASQSYPYTPAAFASLDWKKECETPFDIRFYNNSVESSQDSLFLFGITDESYTQRVAISDSIDFTLPARGAYQAVLWANNTISTCGPSTDTAEFYITVPEAIFDIDSLLCSGLPLNLDGTMSQDVNAGCHKGYQWEFSWRQPYVTQNPINQDVIGESRGDHTITLIVEDINNCRDTLVRDVRFFGTVLNPVADDNRICFPATVNFTLGIDSDTTVNDFTWDFAGIGSSTVQNPSFTFLPNQIFDDIITVTVMTTDALGCPGMTELELSVYQPISVVTTLPPTGLICVGESVTFEASDFTEEGSNLRFAWDFANGITSQNRIETVTYNTPGLFNANLVYTEIGSGCQDIAIVPIDVQEPPQLDFISDVDGDPVICYPTIITFTNTSTDPNPFTPIWRAGNNPLTIGNQYVVGLDRGTTEVSLIGQTSAGCADTLTRSYTLVGPDGGFSFSPSNICIGQEVTFTLQDTVDVESWTWDFGNGITEMNTNPATATYDFQPPEGFTIVSLTLTSQGGQCDFTVTDTLFFNAIVADFATADGADFSCGPEVMFIDQSSGAVRYAYDFGNGDSSQEPSPTYTYPSPGVYSVLLTVENGDGSCSDTTSKNITVLEPLDLQVEIEDICSASVGTITVNTSRVTDITQFSPAGIIASQSGNVFTTVPLLQSQTFSVTVVDSNGCEDTQANLMINVGETFSQPNDTIVILAGSTATLEIVNPGGFTFTWDPAIPGCDGCDNPQVSPLESTDYFVTISDAAGCDSTRVNFRVEIAPPPVVPNLFTPNSDGSNDDWGPLFSDEILPTVVTYEVYSRWGSRVFQSENASEKWSGDDNGNGNLLPSDVYQYVIHFTFPNGEEFKAAGEVTLLR